MCDDETSKIYPDLNPAAPSKQEIHPQNYWLTKIANGKFSKREKIAKKMKCLAAI